MSWTQPLVKPTNPNSESYLSTYANHSVKHVHILDIYVLCCFWYLAAQPSLNLRWNCCPQGHLHIVWQFYSIFKPLGRHIYEPVWHMSMPNNGLWFLNIANLFKQQPMMFAILLAFVVLIDQWDGESPAVTSLITANTPLYGPLKTEYDDLQKWDFLPTYFTVVFFCVCRKWGTSAAWAGSNTLSHSVRINEESEQMLCLVSYRYSSLWKKRTIQKFRWTFNLFYIYTVYF